MEFLSLSLSEKNAPFYACHSITNDYSTCVCKMDISLFIHMPFLSITKMVLGEVESFNPKREIDQLMKKELPHVQRFRGQGLREPDGKDRWKQGSLFFRLLWQLCQHTQGPGLKQTLTSAIVHSPLVELATGSQDRQLYKRRESAHRTTYISQNVFYLVYF